MPTTKQRPPRGRLHAAASGWLPALLALSLPLGAPAIDTAALPDDLTQMSLEELLAIEVVSVSKRAEPIFETAAAVHVITGEEIRRSGARRIADALRLVPGLHVAQSNANSYAVSARGFTSPGDKLEVLVDGHSVYSPLTSAVFWDVLDTYMPDIERIEVIRGPGATLWGANAVNGVVNIVTRNSAETLGAGVAVHAGDEEIYGAEARLGTRLGESGTARLYAQGAARDGGVKSDGSDAIDGMRSTQAGLRADWRLGGGELTLAGGGYHAAEDFAAPLTGVPSDTERSGGDVWARYACCAEEDGRWSLQAAYDGYHANIPTLYSEQRRTATLDFEQHWRLGERNTLSYGAAIKYSRDETGSTPLLIIFDPQSRSLRTFSAFVQDQLSVLDGAGTLTLGSKFEHHSISGFEIQPGIRFGLKLSPETFTWASVARAVRTPNRIDEDIAIFCPPPDGIPDVCGPGVFRIGNPDQDSEKLIAYEWGLRLRTGSTLSWDLATYYNDYSELRSSEPTLPFPTIDNKLAGRGYGGELSAIWHASDRLELRPFYAYSALDIRQIDGGMDVNSQASSEGSYPRHRGGLRVGYQPALRWTVDGLARYVGALARTTSSATADSSVPSYTELSLRIAHRFASGLELAIIGNNLLDPSHPEFGNINSRAELQRGVLAELSWAWR